MSDDYSFVSIQNIIAKELDAKNVLIESDLLSIWEGPLVPNPAIEIIYQQRDNEFGSRYRGMRKAGVMVIDHHPDWRELKYELAPKWPDEWHRIMEEMR